MFPTLPAAVRDHLRLHDPEHDALRRALRAGLVIPLAFALGLAVGGAQTPLFAAFGSFAVLVFADFPGDRRARATSYLGLGVVGTAMITVATVVSRFAWLSVTAMFVVGAVVIFVGVLSAALAAAQRSVLLTFVLPVATPAPPSAIPDRLLGWAIALACGVPAALYLLAPHHHDRLRRQAAQTCRLLADLVTGDGDPGEARATMRDLRTSFQATACRPVGLSAGSRALVRVVGELEWLTDRLTLQPSTTAASGSSPETSARVLRAAATTLDAGGPDIRAAVVTLEGLVAELDSERDRVFGDFAAATDHRAATAALASHALDSAVAAVGRIVAWSGAADARPVINRLLGRGLAGRGADGRAIPAPLVSPHYTRGYLRSRAVTLQNSLRGGLGLAAAVAVTEFVSVQHGFWVVLGTLSVLRSSALTTGSSVLRAIIGTVLGFAVGAALLAVLGTGPVALWLALPVAIFLAAFVPEVVSFAAGQAAFTLTVLLLFNVIDPVGFRVGLIRIEDVVIGSAVAAVVALVLWPRNVASAMRIGDDAAVAAGTRFLLAAVHHVTHRQSLDATIGADAYAAARTFDDDVRQYLAESGGEPEGLTRILQASTRVVRTVLAAEAIGRISPDRSVPRNTAADEVLERHAVAITRWLTDGGGRRDSPSVGAELLDALDGEQAGSDLLWTAAHLNELEVLWAHQSRSGVPV
ncbi:MAG: FUSC family protein [Actinomycetota bacterium]|nr:FUSC family protein [Actinomycetota bacterium]